MKECRKMNEIFLIGEIVSEIKFDFIINNKEKSIARFFIKTIDNQDVEVRAYSKLADFSYSKLEIGKFIFLYGKLRKNFIVPKSIVAIQGY